MSFIRKTKAPLIFGGGKRKEACWPARLFLFLHFHMQSSRVEKSFRVYGLHLVTGIGLASATTPPGLETRMGLRYISDSQYVGYFSTEKMIASIPTNTVLRSVRTPSRAIKRLKEFFDIAVSTSISPEAYDRMKIIPVLDLNLHREHPFYKQSPATLIGGGAYFVQCLSDGAIHERLFVVCLIHGLIICLILQKLVNLNTLCICHILQGVLRRNSTNKSMERLYNCNRINRKRVLSGVLDQINLTFPGERGSLKSAACH